MSNPTTKEVIHFCAALSAELCLRLEQGWEVYLHYEDELVPAESCCPHYQTQVEKVSIGRLYQIAYGSKATKLRQEQ